jgi:sugar phosphate isomerase/epimerase
MGDERRSTWRPGRRTFMAGAGTLAGGLLAPTADAAPAPTTPSRGGPRLGTITYQIAAQMDLPTLIKLCRDAAYEGVELRTTHAHGVEPALPKPQRKEVRQRFADANLVLWGLGTVCEFHAPDPAVVRKNVEDAKAFCQLAADVGARGVKVRPNALVKGVEPQKTLEQIGKALQPVGKAAADLGVEIWVEVHGTGTPHPPHMRTIMDQCGHPSVGICWNSNPTDVKDGTLAESFGLLGKFIRSCHINELWSGYPYRELFSRMRAIGYDRFTLMEVAGVPEAPGAKEPVAALRFMRYYRTLWTELNRAA